MATKKSLSQGLTVVVPHEKVERRAEQILTVCQDKRKKISKRGNGFYASLLVPSFSCSFSLSSLSVLVLFPRTFCLCLANLALGLTQRFWVVCIHPKLWAGEDHCAWWFSQPSWTLHSPEGDSHIRGVHGTVCQLLFFNHGPNQLPLRASSLLNC